MRSYGQFCALAKALDVIGDRWTLLIVRELMVRRAARYTDIRGGLPGIASNLLSERLKDLEDAGVLTREEVGPPTPAVLYRLTERGLALRPVLRELGRWGAPLLAQSAKSDELRGYWIGLPAELYLRDAAPHEPPVTLEVRIGDEPVCLATVDGEIRSTIGSSPDRDAVLSGPAKEVAGVLLAGTSLAEATRRGVRYRGSPAVLARFSPRHPQATSS
jgi:DNA-binding HxlR family transcriptional regulator